MERIFENGRKLRLVTGDITKIEVDAIVNAANERLVPGGGVDGAIHRAGGRNLTSELAQIRQRDGGCPTGSAVVTGAHALPARFVFHAVGPVYRDGRRGEAAYLAACYETCLRLADGLGVESISFPSISTGVYGYPMEDAGRVALEVMTKYLERGTGSVSEIVAVLFDQEAFDTYVRLLE
jgi:O-acetyl-ADP-ribose deacetylase (regulator of RNase III)